MNKILEEYHLSDNEIKIVKPISKGGQKQVFLARHEKYGDVAFKIGKYDSIRTLERIQREIDGLMNHSNPYFPKVYRFDWDRHKKEFFIVEEFIEAPTLREVMGRFDSEKKIIRLLEELVNGLSFLWEKNVIHRDLKPENLLITESLKPVIIDLGIARFLDLESLTETINLMGPCTPIYASPEQLTNKKTVINQRTDFFSLGIIMLELMLGHHPFDGRFMDGNDNSIIENIIEQKHSLPQSDKCSERFVHLTSRMLKKEQFLRFRNYRQLLNYINECWSGK